MKIKYYSQVRSAPVLQGIKELLTLCDKEFVPPLSERASTTQADLLSKGQAADGVESYYREIAAQSALVAFEGRRVIGFLSMKRDYVCEHIDKKFQPNLYVTTIIVHPQYRHKSVAGKMYDVLRKRFPKRYLFTRTWSTNLSHIRILLSRRFHEHCVLENDRGENIDTNYYRADPQKTSFFQYIRQYRLGNNIFFGTFLLLVTLVFIAMWLLSDDGVMHELSLAIATSLMASVLCLASDTFLKIRESKNDNYINTLKSYGIENLQFNKNELLESIIPQCRREIWITGCRLVMTSKSSFRNALMTACKRSRKMSIKLLATPPWTATYQSIYGKEDVTINYLKVLKDLIYCVEHYKLDLKVRFSEKPLFSDTYKVDDRFITGPYLHCADKYNHRITAKDFFSMDITNKESELYKIFYNDYMTVWAEAAAQVDISMLAEKLAQVEDLQKLDEQQRTQLLRSCCESVKD